MKSLLSLCVVGLGALLFANASFARDAALKYPVQEVLKGEEAKGILDQSIKYYFGNQSHPKSSREFGEYTTNKKTNSVGKSPQRACEWVFLSAMKSLEDRAKSLGANAVVGIVSYYKKNTFSSSTEFECHDGGFTTGVALKGKFVVIGK